MLYSNKLNEKYIVSSQCPPHVFIHACFCSAWSRGNPRNRRYMHISYRSVQCICTQYPDMMHGIDKIHVVLNNLKYAISFILLIRKQRWSDNGYILIRGWENELTTHPHPHMHKHALIHCMKIEIIALIKIIYNSLHACINDRYPYNKRVHSKRKKYV